MFILGGVMYFAAVKIMTRLTGIGLLSGEFNSLDNAFALTVPTVLSLLKNTYLYWAKCLVTAHSAWSVNFVFFANAVLFLASLWAALRWACGKKAKAGSVALALLPVALLPLAMDIMYILNQGKVHDLMNYSFWLIYLLVLLLVGRTAENRENKGLAGKFAAALRWLSMALVFVLLYGNVQSANSFHLQKELESDAFFSYMTRVMYRVEDCDDYIPGETPLVLVGQPEQTDELAGFEGNSRVTGMRYNASPFSDNWVVRPRAYFEYVLNNPAVLADEKLWEDMQTDERVQSMPAYPEKGCIAMLDDVLVVKLG